MSKTRVWRTFPRLGCEHCCCCWRTDCPGVGQHGPDSYYRFTYAVSFAVNDVA
jgi:hypothetical protein